MPGPTPVMKGHVLLLRLRADRDEQAEGCDEGFHAEVNTAAAKIFGMRLVAALLLFLASALAGAQDWPSRPVRRRPTRFYFR